MDLLKELNDQQRHAVTLTDGPLLVLAGAGSGKTRVLVFRVAHILAERLARPDEIVAVTFTNKAAAEMKERVARLLGPEAAPARVGTFHSLCLRLLRREATRIGYGQDFQVFDTDDSLRLLRDGMKEASLDETTMPAREVLRRISAAKNRGIEPEEAEGYWRGTLSSAYARAYTAYASGLKRMNAMDFDDLILNVLRLFERHPDRARMWAGMTRYLLVDEYQDTNPPQYRLVKALSSEHGNVCVVGDEDQSIYRFRGAEIGNILSFQEDFPGAQVVKLTRNYRSSSAILEAANALVRRNKRRLGKDLWTEAGRGQPVRFALLPGDREEAAHALRVLKEWRRAESLDKAAILYRTNAQSRLFEEALIGAGIPYRIYGSLRFYDRKEVKDLMAYLRLAANAADDVSFRRAVNVPSRGLGPATMMAIESAARSQGSGLLEGLRAAATHGALAPRAAAAANGFLQAISDLREGAATQTPGALLRTLIGEIDYQAYLERTEGSEAQARMENVEQLIDAAEESADAGEEPDDERTLLQRFLDRSSLISDTENVQGDRGVNLMTLHLAKGLEFDLVILAGLEEGLFPHSRALESEDDVEEERRLCYVGMTRARRRLQLSAAMSRRLYGEPVASKTSRFIEEIGEENLETYVEAPREFTRSYDTRRLDGSGRFENSGSFDAERRRTRVSLGEEDVSRHEEDDDASGPWRVGSRLQHEQFGIGEVIQVEPADGGQKITVRFRGATRKILTRFARLTPVR